MNFDPAQGRPIVVDGTEMIILDGFTFEEQAFAVLAVRMTQLGTDKMITNRIVRVLPGSEPGKLRLEALASEDPICGRVADFVRTEMTRAMLAQGQPFRIDQHTAEAESHIDLEET